jgi:hypothetical protein
MWKIYPQAVEKRHLLRYASGTIAPTYFKYAEAKDDLASLA